MTAKTFKRRVYLLKCRRWKANVRWLYVWAAVAGLAASPWAGWKAYLWRGYKAYGGEVLLSLLGLVLVAFITEAVGIKKSVSAGTDTDQDHIGQQKHYYSITAGEKNQGLYRRGKEEKKL